LISVFNIDHIALGNLFSDIIFTKAPEAAELRC